MFSRSEREYLERLARGESPADEAAREEFSRGYRRKLRHMIRLKARQGVADWKLYAEALRHDPKLLVGPSAPSGTAVPVYTEPFVRWVRGARSLIRRERSSRNHRGQPAKSRRP